MKKFLVLLLSLCLLMLAVGCTAEQPAAQEQPAAPEQPAEDVAESSTVSFTDSVGRTVEVPAEITKIAVSGPLAQITLFALAPDMLVGVASAWDATAEKYLPTEYYNLPELGQLYGGKGELNLETLLASGAQIVIDVGEPKDTIVEDLDALQEQTGLPFVHITATLDNTGDAYRMLGQLLGRPDEAQTLAQYCDDVYAQALELAGQVEKANILYCLGESGLNVIAKGSYHAEPIDLLANNMAVVDDPSSKGTGNEVDMEQLLNWNPDVILFAPDSIYDTVGDDATWQQLTAIQNGAYFEVPFGPYNWLGFPPSVQRYLGLIWMSQTLYPEAAQYDMYQEVSNYYQLFYHCDLTEEQYQELVANSLGK